jgi:hypothetical protein
MLKTAYEGTKTTGGFMNRVRLDGRTIAIGIIAILFVVLILPRLFGGNDTDRVDNDPVDNGNRGAAVDENIRLGRPVAAYGVDADGCPVDETDDFRASDDIYVVAPDSAIPQDTGVFVRLYRDGDPVEDTREIVSDRDYDSTCINFVFEPVNGSFEPGNYEAQFYVNGNAADTVSFEVR